MNTTTIKNDIVETSDVAEVKVPMAESIFVQEDLELKTKRENLLRRKDMLCIQIASDIRLSDTESISSWVDRISKDVGPWRSDLEYLESEIAKIDVESKVLAKCRKCDEQYTTLCKEGVRILRLLETIQKESLDVIIKLNEHQQELNELRQLSNKPEIITLPTEKMYYTEDGPFDSDGCGIVTWKPWSDGIELAIGYEHVPAYAGYGRCTKCGTNILGGESHECKPKTGNIIQNGKIDHQQARVIIQLPQTKDKSDIPIKPRLSPRSHTNTCDCPQSDIFSAAGQRHYCYE